MGVLGFLAPAKVVQAKKSGAGGGARAGINPSRTALAAAASAAWRAAVPALSPVFSKSRSRTRPVRVAGSRAAAVLAGEASTWAEVFSSLGGGGQRLDLLGREA